MGLMCELKEFFIDSFKRMWFTFFLKKNNFFSFLIRIDNLLKFWWFLDFWQKWCIFLVSWWNSIWDSTPKNPKNYLSEKIRGVKFIRIHCSNWIFVNFWTISLNFGILILNNVPVFLNVGLIIIFLHLWQLKLSFKGCPCLEIKLNTRTLALLWSSRVGKLFSWIKGNKGHVFDMLWFRVPFYPLCHSMNDPSASVRQFWIQKTK